MHYCTRLERTSPTVLAHTTAGRAQDSSLTRSAVKHASLPSSLPPRLRNPAIPSPFPVPYTSSAGSQPAPFSWLGSLSCVFASNLRQEKSSPKVLLLTCPPFSFPCRHHLRRLLKKPTPILKVTSVAEILLSPPSRPPHYC